MCDTGRVCRSCSSHHKVAVCECDKPLACKKALQAQLRSLAELHLCRCLLCVQNELEMCLLQVSERIGSFCSNCQAFGSFSVHFSGIVTGTSERTFEFWRRDWK